MCAKRSVTQTSSSLREPLPFQDTAAPPPPPDTSKYRRQLRLRKKDPKIMTYNNG